MKIIFSGGFTLGPVTPLLALADLIRREFPEAEFLWIGTIGGPEKEMVERRGIQFVGIPSGKIRRYLSLKNISDLYRIHHGYVVSKRILRKFKPDICITAGGFVSVPLHFAAKRLGIATWVHQQDLRLGFANKLMIPFARVFTVALEKNINVFPGKSAEWIGNPVRDEILHGDGERARTRFGIAPGRPVLFALGGGTGSTTVNRIVAEAVPHLAEFCDVLHLAGRDRPKDICEKTAEHFSHYHFFDYFDGEMADAYALADVVVCRAGFGTLTELSALRKTAILVPDEGHQEDNAKLFTEAGAAVVVDERVADGNYLANIVRELLIDKQSCQSMSVKWSNVLPITMSETVARILRRTIGDER
ncbi:MAG TPA: UDP-N-acetylglucosamine--N-acetylmuramyl-(pentapeptide) pyrophosphoryl-undecaprenol N-acetylglucosamine transferase [Candidatus Magasanikbacteria bacterium]|nr:UDP-N-acetylglucosamine--N-acetylmuramyl-(pentapeptide) pyrophosphoryl-undecaprenol N-acetylglucosamine transferase [Candidatus Magasanikbacteria bacterium]